MSTARLSTVDLPMRLAPRVGTRAWRLAWTAAQIGLAGLVLVVGAERAVNLAAALAVMAAPGLLAGSDVRTGSPSASVEPMRARGQALILIAWTLAAAAAVVLGGGASGPLGAYALAPAAAAVVLGAPWTAGLAAAAAVAAFSALVQLDAPIIPADPAANAVAAGGALLIMALAATAACAARQRHSAPAGCFAAVAVALKEPEAEALGSDAPEQSWPERLRRAERDRDAAQAASDARARILANMSHELRTPLNAIMGFSDIMRTRLFGAIPERYGEYAELIHESGSHLVELINDVLDLAKIDAERFELHREVFDAREPVNAALRLMRGQAEEAGVQLGGALLGEPIAVEADRRAVKQIVLNLLSNAIKFTPSGGRAAVTLERIGVNEIELTVTDTGIGVAPEDIGRLGSPFEQTDAGRRTQGSGLGLSLVRGFAKLHGGEMRIQSRLGEGAAVSVRLPIAVAA